MVTVTFKHKRKHLELRLYKNKVHVTGKKLSQSGLFPIRLVNDDLNWKLCLNYDLRNEIFLLQINDISFLDMPIQSEVNPKGPQNICCGAIEFNEKVVNDGFH